MSESLFEPPWGVWEMLGATLRCLRDCDSPWDVWKRLWATLRCLKASVNQLEVFKSIFEPHWGVWEPLWANLRYLRAHASHIEMFDFLYEPSWGIWKLWKILCCLRVSVSNLRCIRAHMRILRASVGEPRGFWEPLRATGVWEPLWITLRYLKTSVSHLEVFKSHCEPT